MLLSHLIVLQSHKVHKTCKHKLALVLHTLTNYKVNFPFAGPAVRINESTFSTFIYPKQSHKHFYFAISEVMEFRFFSKFLALQFIQGSHLLTERATQVSEDKCTPAIGFFKKQLANGWSILLPVMKIWWSKVNIILLSSGQLIKTFILKFQTIKDGIYNKLMNSSLFKTKFWKKSKK